MRIVDVRETAVPIASAIRNAYIDFSLMTAAQAALAADTGGNKAQTTRMSQCSSEAKEKGLKGDARKEFVDGCIKTKGASANVG